MAILIARCSRIFKLLEGENNWELLFTCHLPSCRYVLLRV